MTSETSDAIRFDSIWRKLGQRYEDNGAQWSLYHLLGRSFCKVGQYFETKSRDIEREHGRPGVNTVAENRMVWAAHDWSQGGEEWSVSPEWRQGLIDHLLSPNVRYGANIVEIGPGGGRWTSELHQRADRLYLADITSTTLDICRRALGDAANVRYVLSDGGSLPGVPDGSIDCVWSFDVFVHIAPAQVRQYLNEMARVMRPGARAVIHHSGDGNMGSGWRSAMTGDLFKKLLDQSGLRLVCQTDRWGPDGMFGCPEPGDVVSIFEA